MPRNPPGPSRASNSSTKGRTPPTRTASQSTYCWHRPTSPMDSREAPDEPSCIIRGVDGPPRVCRPQAHGLLRAEPTGTATPPTRSSYRARRQTRCQRSRESRSHASRRPLGRSVLRPSPQQSLAFCTLKQGKLYEAAKRARMGPKTPPRHARAQNESCYCARKCRPHRRGAQSLQNRARSRPPSTSQPSRRWRGSRPGEACATKTT